MKTIILILGLTFAIAHSTFAAELPLRLSDDHWQKLHYSKIKPNTFVQRGDGIEISVRESKSPLIYVFDAPQLINSLKVTGFVNNLPVIADTKEQGDKGLDDFALRFGLVLKGRKRLSFAQKLVAADWVKTLFKLAPANMGIDHVLFLDLANPEAISWQQRDIEIGKGLLKERIIKHINANEAFTLEHEFDQPLEVLAFWISSDGDDTKSSFDLTINSIFYD